MVEGLDAPRGQIWPVPEWDEQRVSHGFCPPELNLWVSSLLLLTIYPEKKRKKAECKCPRHNPPPTPGCSQSFILSDSSLLRIKSFNPHSLYCLTYTSKWKSCALTLSWFSAAPWSIFLIRWRETNDPRIIDLVAIIGKRRQWRNLKTPEVQFLPPRSPVQPLNISLLLPLN